MTNLDNNGSLGLNSIPFGGNTSSREQIFQFAAVVVAKSGEVQVDLRSSQQNVERLVIQYSKARLLIHGGLFNRVAVFRCGPDTVPNRGQRKQSFIQLIEICCAAKVLV